MELRITPTQKDAVEALVEAGMYGFNRLEVLRRLLDIGLDVVLKDISKKTCKKRWGAPGPWIREVLSETKSGGVLDG